MSTPPPRDNQRICGERAPVTIPGSQQPTPVACLLVTAVDENAGTLTGHWVDLDAPPDLAPGGVLVLDRTSVMSGEHREAAAEGTHRTTSLFRWTDDGPVKVAEWCGLNDSWPAVTARTAAFWLHRDAARGSSTTERSGRTT